MKLQKVLALTLLAATVGCASTPVTVKNIANNNANTSVVNVNKTGSVTVPVTFPAFKKFGTKGVDYDGGAVQAVYVTVQSLDIDGALTGTSQTYVLVRNSLCTTSYAGGSSTVTFSNINAGKAVVSVYTSDVAPKIGAGAGAAITATNAINVVYDPTTMAAVDAVAGTSLNQTQTVATWMNSHPIVLFPVGVAGATVATDHLGSDPTLDGFDGKIVTVAAGVSTAATLTVSGREPRLNNHSISTFNTIAGDNFSVTGTTLANDDIVIVDADLSGTVSNGDYVYPLTASSTTAATFAPNKLVAAAPLFLARGLNKMGAVSTRGITVKAAAVDVSKTLVRQWRDTNGDDAVDNAEIATLTTFSNVSNPTTGALLTNVLTFAGNTITRSAGDFKADGFRVGDVITILGCTDAPGNNKTATITGITATVLTFAASTFTAESNEAGLVTITSPGYTALAYKFYDAYNNFVSNVSSNGTLPTGVTQILAVTAGNSATVTTPTGDDLSTMTYGAFVAAANASEFAGRKVTITNAVTGGFTTAAHRPTFNTATNTLVNKSVLAAGSYTLEIGANANSITLKSGTTSVASFSQADPLAAGSYILSNASGVPIMSVTTPVTYVIATHGSKIADLVLVERRTTSSDTDVLTATVTKNSVNKVFTVTGSY